MATRIFMPYETVILALSPSQGKNPHAIHVMLIIAHSDRYFNSH
jgi:hypothetical protein